jgi:general secretion pathway protein A
MPMSSVKWPKEPPKEPTEKEPNSSHSLVLGYYGFREEPFGVTPNPRFLYFSPSHREALASLVYAIEAKRGFSALIADPGTGKTTLLFHLLEKMKASARTVFLFRPNSNARELLQSMLSDLGLDVSGLDVPRMHETLNRVLLQELQADRHFLWVLDEAQDVDVDVLEVVRLLSNFETTHSKLMHIVLSGQPTLLEKLERPELLQLRQRVSAVVHLSRLNVAEVCEYIDHRLRLSGCKNPSLFPVETQQLIAKVSRGIPRNINNLCFLCLSLGFAEQSPVITPDILKAILADHEAVNQIADRARAKVSSTPPVSEVRDFPRDIPNVPPLPHLQDAPRASTAWLDQELGYVQPPPPRRSWFLWGFGAVLVFLVIPLGLFVIASDSNINFLDGNSSPALESLVQSVTGYNPHLPDPPAATALALRPPSLPDNLADLTKPPTTSETAEDSTAEDSTPTKLPEAAAAKANPPASKSASASAPAARPTGPRTVYAVRDETIFQLAMEHYGRANWAIVAKIRAQNPQMADTSFVTIERGQRVVLPDLSPEYPWKFPISTSPPSKAPAKYSRRF